MTYPSAGYVAYRRLAGLPRFWRILLLAVVAGLVAAAIALLVARPFAGLDIMPLVTGLLLTFVLGLVAWRSTAPRFYLLVVFSALAGLGSSLALSAYYAAIGPGVDSLGLLTLNKHL